MINTRKNQYMMRLLEEHGYNSQIDLVKALVQTEHYKGRKINSLRVRINDVINRKVTLTKRLKEALLEVCNGDTRIIDRLRSAHNPSEDVEYALESKLNEVYQSFRERFLELDWKGKADMCSDFETYINGYLVEREINEKEE